MLILAGVAISMLVGENSVIGRAEDTKAAMEQSSIEDTITTSYYYDTQNPGKLDFDETGEAIKENLKKAGYADEDISITKDSVNNTMTVAVKGKTGTDPYTYIIKQNGEVAKSNTPVPPGGENPLPPGGEDEELRLAYEVIEEGCRVRLIFEGRNEGEIQDIAEIKIDGNDYDIAQYQTEGIQFKNEAQSVNVKLLDGTEFNVTIEGYIAEWNWFDLSAIGSSGIVSYYKGNKATLTLPEKIVAEELEISGYNLVEKIDGRRITLDKEMIEGISLNDSVVILDLNGYDIYGIENGKNIEKIIGISENWTMKCGDPYFPNIVTVALKDGITTIPKNTFSQNDFQEIQIPSSVESIGEKAFERCSSLRTISTLENVKNIDAKAFWGCSALQEITLYNNLEKIDDQAFLLCSNLDKINFNGSMNDWNDISISDSAFESCGTITVTCTDGTLTIN